MTIDDIRKKITPILQASGVEYAAVFGSVARGEAGPGSDVDVLVKFIHPTFVAYLKLDGKLRQALKRDVDLVTEGAVNKFLRPAIEQDLKVIYGQRPNLPRRD